MVFGLRIWAAAVAVAAAVCGGGAVPAQASAQNAPPLEAYGALPAIEYLELSPSGDRLARITVAGEIRALVVTDMAGALLFVADVGDVKVRDLRWLGEDKVLVVTSRTESIASLGVPRSELYFGQILDLQTQRMVQVLNRTPDVLAVLYGPATIRRSDEGATLYARGVNLVTNQIDLHAISLTSGRGRPVKGMDREIEDFVQDPSGDVIAMGRYVERSKQWTLRLKQGNFFRDGWSTEAPIDTPAFYGLGRKARSIIIGADRPDLAPADPEAETLDVLFEVDVDTGEWSPLPFEHHPDFLVHHPVTQLLIGAGRTEEDGVHYEFIDADAARRWAAIERAFAGKRPKLVSWNDAQDQIVVFTDQGEAGVYQLIDFRRGVAEILAEPYPTVLPEQVGATRLVTYKAADGLEIPAYLTLPPGVETPKALPLIVLAHGGPAARDEAGFDWWAQALASRGYAVLQANFRGSTGYGRSFMEAGYGEWGRKMQTDLSDGVRWLASEGIIDPERVCIVGASYGGYAAMAGMTLDAGVYRCGVAVSGVSDLRRMVNWEARQEGRNDSQTVRYWNRFMGAARLNDRALDALSPAYLAQASAGPLLLLHGRDDTVVPIDQSRIMAEALRRADKPVEFIELQGEDHWLSRTETRHKMLSETVRFLERHNPPVAN